MRTKRGRRLCAQQSTKCLIVKQGWLSPRWKHPRYLRFVRRSANATGLQPAQALQLRRSSCSIAGPEPGSWKPGSGPAVSPLGKDLFEKCSRRDSNPHCPEAPAFETGVSANCTTRTIEQQDGFEPSWALPRVLQTRPFVRSGTVAREPPLCVPWDSNPEPPD